MNHKILFSPPFAFAIILLVTLALSRLCSFCSFRKRQASLDSQKAYACGEDFKEHLIQPDYSRFFPFAFFFTILHVVALVVATVPNLTTVASVMVGVYVSGAVIGLVILLRK